MWLTHTILIHVAHHTIPDLCGSPTRFLIYVAHPHDSWFMSPTQFLIYVARPQIPDLCGSPTQF
jgi:hypothetical protein